MNVIITVDSAMTGRSIYLLLSVELSFAETYRVRLYVKCMFQFVQ